MATILSMSFLASQTTTLGIAENVQSHAQARSVAESALVAAIHYVQSDSGFRNDKAHGQWVSGASFNGGTFDLYGYDGLDTDSDGVVDDTDSDLADDTADPITLTAVGYFDGVSHTVHAVVTVGEAGEALNVLMVVGNAGSLSTRDQAKKDLMEGWGMTVTLLSDQENQSAYDAAAADADVAYITESVSSGTVGTKTNGFTIGVVNDEPYLNDALEVASSNGSSFTDNRIDIIDNSHYITSEIADGDMNNLVVTTSSQTHYSVSGTLGSGATVLATRDSNADPTLVAVDIGAQLEDGSSAAGRRVLLPWGSSIDMSTLNSVGEQIIERSLRWAGAEVAASSTSIGIAAADTIKIKDDGNIDSFDSSQGAYGGANAGASAVISTNTTSAFKVTIESGGTLNGDIKVGAGGDPSSVISNSGTITGASTALTENVTIPSLSAPTGMPSSQGDVTISSGTTVYSSDQQFEQFTASSSAIIQISGDVTILANDDFTFEDSSQLQLLPGATLTLYLNDKFKAKDTAQINVNTADPTRLVVNILVNKHFDTEDSSHVYATVVAPLGQLHPSDDSHFYGTFQGNKVEVKDNAWIHQDLAGASAVQDSDGPQLIALYEFEEVASAEPSMVGHWKLDDAAGVSASGASAGEIRIEDSGVVDSFNSADGAYSGSNSGSGAQLTTNLTSSGSVVVEGGAEVNGSVLVGAGGSAGTAISNSGTITGTTGAQSTNATIPTVTEPSGMPANQGDVTISSGTTVFSSDQQFDEFTLDSSAILQISGNVTILANDEFKLDSSSQLQLLPGATLKLYLKDKYKAKSSAEANVNTADPSRFIIYGLSNKHIDFEDSSHTYATVIAPDGLLHVKDSSHFYGKFAVGEVEVKGSGELHHDSGVATYDFAGGSQGADVWAYDGQSTSATPSNATTPSTQLSGGEYNDIEDNDSDEHEYKVTQNGRYGMMRFVFEISEAEADVSQLDVSWIGENENKHGPRTDGVALHIWNYNSGSYEQLDISADTDSEVTLGGSITSNLTDYIGGGSDNQVTLLAVTRDKRTGNKDNKLKTDYVSLAVTLGGGAASITAVDEIAGNNGTSSGEATAEASGNGDGGTAIGFDGVDDYIEIAHDNTYLLDEGALSFWFNPDDTSGLQALVSKDSTGYDTGGHLHVYLDGSTLKARLQSDSAGYTVQASGISAGSWSHAVVTWGPGGLRLLVDGVQEDTDAYTGGLGSSSGSSGNYEPIVLGAGTSSSDDLVATTIDEYYAGRIDDVRFYDGGLNATQAGNLYSDTDPGTGDATIAYDTSGYGTALDLQIEDLLNVTWESGGGLTLNSATRLISETAATKIYDALSATDQFSIELQFTPLNNSQSGPARLFDYSNGASDINVMVGQDADALVARLNTADTTSNGTPEADSGSVLTGGAEAHMIVSYDGENLVLYRDGAAAVTLARTGDLDWDNTFDLILGNGVSDGYGWLGTLHRVAVYDQGFTQGQADNVFGGGEPGDPTDAGGGTASVDWIEP